ncbi:hypothetical protein HanPI659440_Chr12g0460231 [Helianthus annuus]|nr:hypothetical protein HanPI659440_Chr12g0460231 [Helianthus annuus]
MIFDRFKFRASFVYFKILNQDQEEIFVCPISLFKNPVFLVVSDLYVFQTYGFEADLMLDSLLLSFFMSSLIFGDVIFNKMFAFFFILTRW